LGWYGSVIGARSAFVGFVVGVGHCMAGSCEGETGPGDRSYGLGMGEFGLVPDMSGRRYGEDWGCSDVGD